MYRSTCVPLAQLSAAYERLMERPLLLRVGFMACAGPLPPLTAFPSTGVSRHDATGSYLAQVSVPIRRAHAQRLQPQADGLPSLMQYAGTGRLDLPHSCSSMLSILNKIVRLWYIPPVSRLQVTRQAGTTRIAKPSRHFRPGCVTG